MLPKENRLKKEQDFKRVHQRGKFFSEQFLALKLLKNNLNCSRFGFIVGLKISKKATVRNKIQRRLREIVRFRLYKLKKGFDIILMVRPEIIEKDYQEIEKVAERIFKKAKLM